MNGSKNDVEHKIITIKLRKQDESSVNTPQRLAVDPNVSAWVAASAGTGKTKVLTDRILNLLLHGFAPERILCLTFTRAAAAEMASRLTHQLGRWATLADDELRQDLQNLVENEVLSPSLLTRARRLFTLVLDAPGGMKIQTIHGFCQSVLGRFPLEANIPPHFQVLDENQVEEALLEVQQAMFAKPSALLERALATVNLYTGDNRFSTILKDCHQDRTRITSFLDAHPDFWAYAQKLVDFLEVQSFVNQPEDLLNPDLIPLLKAQFVPVDADFETYVATYLTKTLEIRKKLSEDQQPEAERVFRLVRSLGALETAQRTVATLLLFQEMAKEYQNWKVRRCTLDYEDLVQETRRLLTQPGVASWVLYKLDGGIDHLLVDEAQDTNTVQWEIIQRLTAEFFEGGRNPHRTIFVVGDAKQSIYGFQGANPHDFLKVKDHFSGLSQKAGQDWRTIRMDLSYRSMPAILTLVDTVFANHPVRQGVSLDGSEIVHQVFRKDSLDHLPGLVELWPLIEPEREDSGPLEDWSLPVERQENRTPQSRLAEFLTSQIEGWLASPGILPSTNRPVQPRDILVLVRKRSVLGNEIIRCLKNRGIPVAGADRLVLTDHIAIMDLLALGQFVLLPEDDLSLACVLRSPLIGLSEDDLFTLCYGRDGSLWASLSQQASQKASFAKAHEWLKSCLRDADLMPVYEFYHRILAQGEGRRKFLARLGSEVDDVLEEFLTQALSYEKTCPGSLQGFIHFLTRQNQEIKRDASDTSHNQIRLMTVHGSKGLQAPIVILPDAAEPGGGKLDTLLWGEDLVMVRPTQKQDTDNTRFLKHKAAEEMAKEERRLLYVALTRAQDRLYVGGWMRGKELPKDSWYALVQDALALKSGGGHRYQPSHREPDNRSLSDLKSPDSVADPVVLPSWAKTPLESSSPTSGVRTQPAPQKTPSNAAMERGTLIHRFFEYLPPLPESQHYLAACQMLEKEGLLLAEWEDDIRATLDILKNPEFKDWFGPDSLAEVPISGVMDGLPFQGRIDRLLVQRDTVTIIDYKTNRVPPAEGESAPENYVRQLEGYATALKTIYPNHRIRKILLWTTGPKIQEV